MARTKYYSCEAIQNLINHYTKKGGDCWTLEEGSLGYGTTMLCGDGLKTAIVQERYLNEWSSGHTIRLYRKTPKKYLDMLDKVLSAE